MGAGRSVGPYVSYVEVAELRLAAGDRLQFLEERRRGRVAGVGHRFGVAGEFHYRNVPPGVVSVRAHDGPPGGPLGADGGGPPVDDRVPFGDAVGVEIDELDECPRPRDSRLVAQQAAQLLAKLRGIGMPVHGDRVLRGGGDQLVGLAADGQRAAHVVGERATVDDLPGHGNLLALSDGFRWFSCVVGGQGRASKTTLNGVSVARRKRVKPASSATWRMASSPAWAPRAYPPGWERALGTHRNVENE